MLRSLSFLAAVLLCGVMPLRAQSYQGNQSTGFGGVVGQSTLAVSDNPSTGQITFSLTLGAGYTNFNDLAFYLSTGSTGGISNTSSLTDTGDEGRRAISGLSTGGSRSLVNFASNFSATYAVALDSNGHANLFQLTSGSLTYVNGGATYSHPSTYVYSFSIDESKIGLTAGTSAALNFVATLSNANDSSNGGVYRSNEAYGPSNTDSTGSNNLGLTGTLTYTGFDTYATSVPEPATWLAAALCVLTLGKACLSRLRPSRTTA